MLTGAQIVLECLKEEGVNIIFGYPGGAVIPLYDALYDYRGQLTHVMTAHEQGAVHGADGYARSTGKVGVCFTTSGPGATNTVTGIATAYMDSIPIVVITGQVSSPLLGKDSFQEIDITGITLPVTKHNYLVKDIKDLADIIREAFYVAKTGRPGPVLIDIPKDVFLQKDTYKEKEILQKERLDFEYDEGMLKRAAEMINNASKPIIYAGGGVVTANASQSLYELAVKGGIPVVNTLMGLGSFSRCHPLSLGLVGMHGFRESNLAVANSDLIIAVGARFSDRVVGNVNKFASKAEIIHIDIDKTEIGKNKEADFSIVGDLNRILNQLVKCIDKKSRMNWLNEIYSWKLKYEDSGDEFNPRNIIEAINHIFDDDTIVVTDVGQHQMWTAQYWKFTKERTFISSGGLGTMGFGLGAAVGAQMGNPNSQVIHITGDGSFRMNCNELATVSRYKLPIVTILFNNRALGMVRQWQKMFQRERYSETDIGDEVDYIKLAEAYGIQGYKADSPKGLRKILEKVRDMDKPALVECSIDKDECVYPIVPPGKPIDKLILGKEGHKHV